jgi:predicted O-methyltransferase YrrM
MTESIDGLYERYLHNIAPWRHKVTILRGSSRDMLKLPQVVAQKFDFIYVDADHRSRY